MRRAEEISAELDRMRDELEILEADGDEGCADSARCLIADLEMGLREAGDAATAD